MAVPKWITGNELLEPPWNLKGFELLNYIIEGSIQPYDPDTGQPVPSPKIQLKEYNLKDIGEKLVSLKREAANKVGAPPERTPEEIAERKRQYQYNLKKERPEWESWKTPTLADIMPMSYYDSIEIYQWMIEDLEEQISKTGVSWEGYRPPDSKQERLDLISKIHTYLYKLEDVEVVCSDYDTDRAENPSLNSFVEESEANKEYSGPEISIIPCPPGTKWEDIRITLTSAETVRIKTPLGEKHFTFHQLGLSHIQNPEKPIKLWFVLKILANNQGTLSWNDNIDEKDRNNISESMRRLNKRLQKLFGINDSIFKDSYKKLKKYDSKIFFSDQTIVS